MRRKLLSAVTGLLIVVSSGLKAQVSNVAYFMNIPQAHFLNPALKPQTRFYIGLPVISGVSTGEQSNFLTTSTLFTPGIKADSIFSFQNPNFDLKKIAAKLQKRNMLEFDANVQLLGIGFPVGKNFSVMIDVNDRFTAKAVIPKELLNVYIQGGAAFMNQTMNLSNINVKGQLFREYGLGFSGEIIHNLRIGAKVKLISGIGSLSFDDSRFDLKVNSDLSQTVTADATLENAGQEELKKLTSSGGGSQIIHNYLGLPLRNPGFGIDFGAIYNLGSMFSFSFSVKDLGFIKWKDDLQAWTARGSFNLPGITLADVHNQTFSLDKMYSSLSDSIKSNFKPVVSTKAFTTALPTDIIAGASITPLKFITLGILSVSRVYAGSVSEQLTMSANAHVGRVLSASLAYTMANNSYNNLGAGLAITAGVAQIYLIADKIPMVWQKIYVPKGSGNYSAVPLPENFNTLSFQLGVNIVFGKPVTQKTDKPMLQSKDDIKQ